MKSGKLNKMATILAVLFLVMSGVMVVQWNAQPVEATEHEDGYGEYKYKVSGLIDTANIDESLQINLKSLSTGEVRSIQTSGDYSFTDVKPGYYKIIFPSQVEDNSAYMRNTTGPFEVVDQDIKGMDFSVPTKEIDDSLEVNVTLDGETIENPESITVTLEDRTENFKHEASLKENTTFTADIYSDFNQTGRLIVEKEGYAPQFNESGDFDINEEIPVELSKEPLVWGYLVDEDGNFIREEKMDVTLYNETVGVLNKTIDNKESAKFTIRAPSDYNYTLVVDTAGYRPYIDDSISFETTSEMYLERCNVGESDPEEVDTNIDFEGEENLTVMSNRSIRAGTRMETLDHPFIGNLAMQIDLALGNGNGNVTSSDVNEFKQRLTYTNNVSYTPEFITVNGTVYKLTNYTAEFSENFTDKLTGDVTDIFEEEIYFNTTREYTIEENIGSGRHIVDLTVKNDRDYTYNLNLREGYERYVGSDSEEDIPDNVEVEGYTDLEIHPGENGLTSDLTFDVRESDKGEVDINIANEPWIHELEGEGEYIIRKDTEAELMADYQNPTSTALEYNWTLDGDSIGEGEVTTHTFSDGDSGTLTIEVTESRDKTDPIYDSVNITVDDQGPDGDILIDGDVEQSPEVNEDEEIEFSGAEIDDQTGIDQYKWTFNFSDGAKSQEEGMNVTHTFDVPGGYDVTLNVTDGVGNSEEISIDVNVKDTTKPTAIIRTEWDGQHAYDPNVADENLIIGTDVTFNATESVAHEDYEGELENITWWIEEMEMKEEGQFSEYQILENITFDKKGDYTVWANVTDVSGNYRNESVTVNIKRGPTPDLVVSNLRFSKDDIRVGDTVTITVNLTNVGDANTTEITAIINVNGEEAKRINAPVLIKDGEELERDHIEPNEEVTIDIKWEPETDKDMTVNVNVTDEDERNHQDILWDNAEEQTVTVNPPAWREYIVYALIPIIIIGVTVGLYFFRDRLSEILR
ncbi:MAG: PKD domain-containing protein [Candidatus Thermoplasmatota archaeon]